jgi:SNF2 family DNA or RNA helicase
MGIETFEGISEGSIIEAPFWPEPVEIKKVEEFGERIHIIGATIHSSTHIDQLISKEDLKKLKIKEFTLDFSSPADEVFLTLEAKRYQYASLFDPLLAMSTSKIDPLPFQIEAVYGYILKLPRIRFLIADDPGAGKTIMAGLIIKELKLRGLADRILIVVPGHLKDQWRRELKEKFQEPFVVVDRGLLNAHYAENPWQREKQVITSIDFAKREEILPSISSTEWDLVIVDEAHKMSAYLYGDKVKLTERYKLGKVLSQNTNHLLFLTATPHKGDPENFRLFLDLLLPGFFATKELIDESLKNKDNPLFIRRMKEDLKDFEGKPIFTNRYAKTVKFRLSDEEKDLYNELSKYVIFQYNKALQMDKKRSVAFALLILQRRMASSTYALLRSLERRKERLEALLKEPELPVEKLDIDLEEIEDYEEEARWEEEKKWETLSIAEVNGKSIVAKKLSSDEITCISVPQEYLLFLGGRVNSLLGDAVYLLYFISNFHSLRAGRPKSLNAFLKIRNAEEDFLKNPNNWGGQFNFEYQREDTERVGKVDSGLGSSPQTPVKTRSPALDIDHLLCLCFYS